jgi:tetratricopeptide (TPR) repeat protein
VQLEPISAELFALRAEYDFQHQYQRDLTDLEFALKLAPDDAHTHWLKAEILEQVGRYRSALEAANEAVKGEPDSHRYRLTRARLQAHNGEYVLAVKETKEVLRSQGLAPQLWALAECQLGDLIASGPKHQFKEALEHHLEAIKLAAPLANDHRFAPRRLAKEVLVSAHLAAAMDISRGNYKRKESVVAKWVQRAEALVEELVTHDQGDAALQLRLHSTALAASAELEGQLEVEENADEALKLGRRLIAVERDALRQSRIEWELGTAMYEAMRVAAAQGQHTQALRHADNAMVLFEQSAPQRQSTAEQKYLVGKLYFVVGSMHAVHRNDHREAAVWYQKAEPLLSGSLPASAQAEAGLLGERLVSVAVSYWESGSRDKAIELTEKGAEIMQAAVQDGQAPSNSLAVPYGNLATMHEHLGNKEQAKTFAELAAKLEPGLIPR